MRNRRDIKVTILFAIFAILCSAAITPSTGQSDPLYAVPKADNWIQEAASDDETVVYITKTGEKYHRDGCRYLAKSKIKTTLKEANASGYTPCKICKPPT